RPISPPNDASRGLAFGAAHFARCFPALVEQVANQLDLRGHADSNRFGLYFPFPAGLALGARSVDCSGTDTGRLLGSLCALSPPRTGVRLRESGRPAELAPPDDW